MGKHSFTFRTYATDETEHWNLPDALKGATVFGLYFFLEGEATHICSFEANSRMEFLENVFLTPDDPEAAEAYLDGPGDDLRNENGGEWTSYFGFVDVSSPSVQPYIGPADRFTLDTADFDIDPDTYREAFEHARRHYSPQQARAIAERECLRDYAYEAAREEYNANSPAEPPVCWGGAALDEHKRRKAVRKAERAGPPPLFAAAGVPVPIATSPADLYVSR